MALDTSAAVARLNSLTVHFDRGVESSSPLYPELCTTINSGGASEEYGFLGAMPGVREWLGDREFHSLRGARFTIENKLWENSVAIEQVDIEEDRLCLYGPVLHERGAEAMHHPD